MAELTPPTSLTLGLDEGAAYGRAHLSDRARLGRIARAHTADQVLENLETTFRIPGDVDDPVAYWSGFAHGVLRAPRVPERADRHAQPLIGKPATARNRLLP